MGNSREIGLNLPKFRLVAYRVTDTFTDSLLLPIVACQLPGQDENPKEQFSGGQALARACDNLGSMPRDYLSAIQSYAVRSRSTPTGLLTQPKAKAIGVY